MLAPSCAGPARNLRECGPAAAAYAAVSLLRPPSCWMSDTAVVEADLQLGVQAAAELEQLTAIYFEWRAAVSQPIRCALLQAAHVFGPC